MGKGKDNKDSARKDGEDGLLNVVNRKMKRFVKQVALSGAIILVVPFGLMAWQDPKAFGDMVVRLCDTRPAHALLIVISGMSLFFLLKGWKAHNIRVGEKESVIDRQAALIRKLEERLAKDRKRAENVARTPGKENK